MNKLETCTIYPNSFTKCYGCHKQRDIEEAGIHPNWKYWTNKSLNEAFESIENYSCKHKQPYPIFYTRKPKKALIFFVINCFRMHNE